MKIPEFDEFWSTLDEEKMSEFFGESMLNIYQIDGIRYVTKMARGDKSPPCHHLFTASPVSS